MEWTTMMRGKVDVIEIKFFDQFLVTKLEERKFIFNIEINLDNKFSLKSKKVNLGSNESIVGMTLKI